MLNEETLETTKAERMLLDGFAERHQNVMAPAVIKWETRAARVGEQWTSTLYVAEYPGAPKDGYLSRLFEVTDVEFM